MFYQQIKTPLDALVYFTECQVSTFLSSCNKITGKNELLRHQNLCVKMIVQLVKFNAPKKDIRQIKMLFKTGITLKKRKRKNENHS